MTDATRTWAIVYNPTKFDDLETVQQHLTEVAADLNWPEPLWITTTEEDPGASMAQEAVDKGAELVCAMGGDGTVRHVAGVLSGTAVVLGLLPAGTGNLLARNLGLPVDDMDQCLTIALSGDDHTMDIGWATFGDSSKEEPFVIAAGIGLDADIMAETDEDLKAKVGRAAYVASGVKALAKRGFEATVTVDGTKRPATHSRMVMVCNSPSIGGGIDLAADGAIDDGEFATVMVSPKGVFGWASVVADMITGHRKGHGRVQEWAGTEVVVEVSEPTPAEVDGDSIDEVTRFEARMNAGSLVVRVAAPEEEHYPTDEIIENQAD
ncbi:diacylglycerol/lipid kinase family protein [Aestuariimicrobium kwangyangense]|uniref:diacylglycerol/lipid kinase family protein n=1 Tax=Aestuariimicrobium kwangyangense TaxID=396389 RepID=UPI0003B2FDDC|nr:diacylglycerol kinase family protein [Aestuariimicrobium kwangyangense]